MKKAFNMTEVIWLVIKKKLIRRTNSVGWVSHTPKWPTPFTSHTTCLKIVKLRDDGNQSRRNQWESKVRSTLDESLHFLRCSFRAEFSAAAGHINWIATQSRTKEDDRFGFVVGADSSACVHAKHCSMLSRWNTSCIIWIGTPIAKFHCIFVAAGCNWYNWYTAASIVAGRYWSNRKWCSYSIENRGYHFQRSYFTWR